MPFSPSRISKQPTFTSGYNGLLQPRINYGFNPANFRMRNTIEKTGQQFHHADTLLITVTVSRNGPSLSVLLSIAT